MSKKEAKTHTKTEFEAKVAEKISLTKSDSKKVVDAFLETVTEVLAAGDAVSFTGFGKFEVAQRSERIGRNPQTGKEIKIKASKVPKFSAGKLLKDAVNK